MLIVLGRTTISCALSIATSESSTLLETLLYHDKHIQPATPIHWI
jgi:hypothetical protein